MTMELATITMDRDEALDRYHQYRDANKKHWRAEFDQIKRCYRELSKGARLIDIDVAVAAGGTVTKTVEHSGYRKGEFVTWTADCVLPALAIARASTGVCHFDRFGTGTDSTMRFAAELYPRDRSRQTVRVACFDDTITQSRHFRSVVPVIPPHHTPAYALTNYHILWEANWEHVQPRDPALLRHIAGGLYQVIDQWDLTDIEAIALRSSTVAEGNRP